MHMKYFTLVLLALNCNITSAELVPLGFAELSESTAKGGLTVDIDLSSIGLNYAYSNTENPNPDQRYWVVGTNGGSGDSAVGSDIGSGEGLAQLNGITVDIGTFGSQPSIAIGLPSEIKLNRVNVGDYFITRPGSGPADSPPGADDIDSPTNRKLIGIRLNTPPRLNFTNAGQEFPSAAVRQKNFSNDIIQTSGTIHLFAN